MFTVVRQAQVKATIRRVWECLTEPVLLAKWFADTERLEVGRPFHFSFGDGDYFDGTVRRWEEPSLLRLEWRFMGVGPRFEISYALASLSETQTEVTVMDRGALTLEESESLTEGWEDFLHRLATFAQTNQPSRFVWSESISLSANLARHKGESQPPELLERGWWRASFPGSEFTLEDSTANPLVINFREGNWQGGETRARVATRQFESGANVSVTHEGWAHLPEETKRAERRRYAGFWQRALQNLESKYN
jgi:uncharacterized protein YndB with AHSA1/START domain